MKYTVISMKTDTCLEAFHFQRRHDNCYQFCIKKLLHSLNLYMAEGLPEMVSGELITMCNT